MNNRSLKGLDSRYRELSADEELLFRDVLTDVANEAQRNCHKRPKVTAILEEFSEMILSFRGKHEDPPELELIQVASCCINVLWQLRQGADVNNIVKHKIDK